MSEAVAFVFGESAHIMPEKFKKVDDSVNLVAGDSLVTFLNQTKERNEYFKRITFGVKALTTGLEEDDFIYLKQYISEFPNTTVVFFIRKGEKTDLADSFLQQFDSPMFTVAYIDFYMKDFEYIFTREILEIKTRYYTLDKDSQKNLPQETKKPKAKAKKPKKEKKGGFFSSLFGKKKPVQQEISAEESQEADEEVQHTIESNQHTMVATPFIPQEGMGTPVASITPVGGVSLKPVNLGKKGVTNFLGGISEEEIASVEDGLALGSAGDVHESTGYISEDEESQGFDSGFSGGLEGIGFVGSRKNLVSQLGGEGTGNYTSNGYVKSQETLQKIHDFFKTNVNTLVVGKSGAEFLDSVRSELNGYVIIDLTKYQSTLDFIPKEVLVESTEGTLSYSGISYEFGVTTTELPRVLSKYIGYSIILLVDVEQIPDIDKSEFSEVVTILDVSVPKLQSQLKSYEGVSNKVARVLRKSKIIPSSGIEGYSGLYTSLNDAVFGKVNWRGLVYDSSNQ